MKYFMCFVMMAAVAVNAQLQVCQNIVPGKVPAASIKFGNTEYSNSFSSLTVNWPRPNDAPSPGALPSCIAEYAVEVVKRDGNVLQSASVPVSPVHTSASYTAKGLSPGQPYQFRVTAKGNAGTGPTDISSTPFTTAAAFNCRQPQAVTNIRRAGATPAGAKVSMTIAWDPSPSKPECVKEYIVTAYEAGSKVALKSSTIPVPTTRYTDDNYQPGKSYEFYIYARNPSAGAMGNGVGLRSQPIMAPVAAVPL